MEIEQTAPPPLSAWIFPALLCMAPFGFGALALFLGQDLSWDLRNYHWYNAYAFLNGRHAQDLYPAQGASFFNPLIDVPFYLLAEAVPAKVAFFILGTVQGLNFPLIFLLARRCLRIAQPGIRDAACFALAACGMLGGMGISEIGTTFHDNTVSLGIFLSALLLTGGMENGKNSIPRFFLYALPAGIAAGLKLTAAPFCLGLGLAALVAPAGWPRRLLLAAGFGAGIICGIALSYGHWGYQLYTETGNPFFPFFNTIFGSPLAPDNIFRDETFSMPEGMAQKLAFPFLFTAKVTLVNEIYWRDWRIAITYGLGLAALASPWCRARNDVQRMTAALPATALLVMSAGAYAAWAPLFAVYRYIVPLEMLAPLLIVLLLDLFPLRRAFVAGGAGLLLTVISASVIPGDWGRRHDFTPAVTSARLPDDLPRSKGTMILMAGTTAYAHLIPHFPPEFSFIRIESRIFRAEYAWGAHETIARKVASHTGPLMLLIPREGLDATRDILARHGLARVAGTCRTVEDEVYAPHYYDLCDLERTGG